jgi:hypothetical protein
MREHKYEGGMVNMEVMWQVLNIQRRPIKKVKEMV